MKNNKNSWFDDPEWEELRRRVNKQPVPEFGQRKKTKPRGIDGFAAPLRPQKPPHSKVKPQVSSGQSVKPRAIHKNSEKVYVSVNLSLPTLKPPRLSRKQLKIGAAVTAVLALLIAGPTLLRYSSNKDVPATKGASVEVAQKPEFTTVLPDGLMDATTSNKVAYDPQRRVASFTDKIDGIDITVSQQQLPAAFKDDPQPQVEKLAKEFSATEVIDTKSGKAYIGNSAQGPQSVVLSKKGLLIFIFAAHKVENKAWVSYIDSLL